MSIAAVAKKDFRDAIRSRLMIAVAVMFVAFTGGGVALGNAVGLESGTVVALILTVMLGGTAIFVPLVSLGIAYRAIAGERASGSLKLLLSLPNSRLDVVIGKFIGRSAVVSVAVVIGFISMLVAAAASFDGDIQPETILMFMLAALLLAIVFVSIAVSISAFAESTFAAAIGGFGFFVLFQFAWQGVIFLLRYVANGFETPDFGLGTEPPEWVEVLTIVNPMNGWRQSTRWLLRRVSDQQETAQTSVDAFYLEPWFGFVVLALWIVLPLVVGYLRFESSDL
ncbi:ABC transporter permease subunit [Natronomonas marina]|jgi:ABC-2 type transport system permease protein|uniref:ABC transporter permease subunit n=1 Tax=Natronomonas marina TaxID=2961939 RepID=UPI0020C94B1F|nr:ABC transporter permease subunit [Natronomonas marina]